MHPQTNKDNPGHQRYDKKSKAIICIHVRLKASQLKNSSEYIFPTNNSGQNRPLVRFPCSMCNCEESVPNEHSFEFEALADGIHQSCHQVTARTGQLMLM